MISRTAHSRPGVTIMECVAAVVLLGMTAPPMLWAMREAQQDRAASALVTRARWLAAERLEDIIADRHSATRGFSYLQSANYPAETVVAGFPGFSRTVALNQTGVTLTGSGSGYMTVSVTVSWNDGVGARSVTLATVLTDY